MKSVKMRPSLVVKRATEELVALSDSESPETATEMRQVALELQDGSELLAFDDIADVLGAVAPSNISAEDLYKCYKVAFWSRRFQPRMAELSRALQEADSKAENGEIGFEEWDRLREPLLEETWKIHKHIKYA